MRSGDARTRVRTPLRMPFHSAATPRTPSTGTMPIMRIRALLFAATLALAASACGGGDSARYESAGAAADMSTSTEAQAPPAAAGREGGAEQGVTGGAAGTIPPGAATDSAPAAAPMIIRNGTASVEVDSLEPAVARMRQLATSLGGYVANTVIETGEQQARSAMLQLKIPSARFDQAVSGLNPLGRVEKVEVTAEDVGEEYVDVSARVANARRMEERLTRLLATQTGKLEEVLTVERELARVREEIERYDGRLRYLRQRAAVSTLAVTLHEPYPVVGDYPGSSPIGQAFRTAWRNFVSFVAGLIAASGVLIPLALLLGAGWWVFRKLFPGAFRRRDHAPPPPPPARERDEEPRA